MHVSVVAKSNQALRMLEAVSVKLQIISAIHSCIRTLSRTSSEIIIRAVIQCSEFFCHSMKLYLVQPMPVSSAAR